MGLPGWRSIELNEPKTPTSTPVDVGADLNECVLFDGHALGQIARLIHVGALEHGHVIGEQL